MLFSLTEYNKLHPSASQPQQAAVGQMTGGVQELMLAAKQPSAEIPVAAAISKAAPKMNGIQCVSCKINSLFLPILRGIESEALAMKF